MKKFLALLLLSFTMSLQVVAKDNDDVAEQEDFETDADEGTSKRIYRSTAFVLQPADLIAEIHPSFELTFNLRNHPKFTQAISFAYWGTDQKRKENRDSDLEENVEKTIRLTMNAAAARYKIYLGRSFHFNFGLGVRKTTSTEQLDYVKLKDVSAEKTATSLGIDIGLGNRWVFANGIVIGGNWLQIFYPIKVLSEKDATAPEDHTIFESTAVGQSTKKADGDVTSFRIAILDIGYAW
jgi:hypothetical protein